MKSRLDDLREWQRAALHAWREHGYRGIASVVTGGGKTRFAMECLWHYRATVPAATCVIVVPTNALLDQWVEEATTYLDVPFSEMVVLSGRQKIVLSRLNVGVINTVAKIAPTYCGPNLFLVVDECHRAASEAFRQCLSFPTDATLGLSATPERPYDDGLREVLEPSLGPVIATYSYREALRDGVIVPFTLINVMFEMAEDEWAAYQRLTASIGRSIAVNGMESPQTIRLLIRRTRISNLSLARIRIALSIVSKNGGRQIILFHEDIHACGLLEQALREFGVSCAAYHSKKNFGERVSSLRAFRAKEINVLITCRALDEGFNVPEAEVGIIAASTATYRQRIQRLGRVLRPASGKTHAEIYSIVSTEPEVRRLAQEAVDMEDMAYVRWVRM